ncbi:SdpC family antimicrobial peptide [Mycetocola sp. BIGb0189]|uniref:hypothetical protein n=1 Tax=Mycetocola sp. BIGb0189 TaxID=2940604 RepID=UPI00216772F6|nr:hypothetical protein [Mycetocola sp. BIGb0189]MCS4277310.1 SdpC family antimicrobial peptide [Mycetocola sp. BIGb0189]
MHRFIKISLGLITGTALIFGSVNVASAATAPTKIENASSTTDAYTDADVVEFLVFGSGAVAKNNPSEVKKLGLKSQTVSPETVTAATGQIVAADPNFRTHVAKAVLSGNPYKIRQGLKSFTGTLEKVAQDQIPGDISTNCVIWGIVNVLVAIELVVAGAVVVVVAYRGDNSTSRFSQDEIAATLTALR